MRASELQTKHRPTAAERRAAMLERLRYFVYKSRRDRKLLTTDEIDELCQIILAFAPPEH